MLKNLPIGALQVEVDVPGFVPQTHKVTTTPDATLVSDFELVPELGAWRCGGVGHPQRDETPLGTDARERARRQNL